MNNFPNPKLLFGNDEHQSILIEYDNEIKLIRNFINAAESCILNKKENDILSHNGICYSFAKSIINYSKMAFDNFVLGHFNATGMITRALLENYIFLNIIYNHEKEELWKYYLIQSYKQSIKKSKVSNWKDFNQLCKDLKIDKEFSMKQNNQKYSYINLKYGWTYKINKYKSFYFTDLCNIVNPKEYIDYADMSEYSHGTDYFLKINSLLSTNAHTENFISFLYTILLKTVSFYCPEFLDDTFNKYDDALFSFFMHKENH